MLLKESIKISNRVKQLSLLTFLFLIIGTLSELFLLHHYEGWQQFIPIVLISLSLVFLLLIRINKNEWVVKSFQILMILSALSGIYGTYLHLRANYEFEQEMIPTAQMWDLLLESLTGALPALAPGSMIVFALIGFTYLTIIKQHHEK